MRHHTRRRVKASVRLLPPVFYHSHEVYVHVTGRNGWHYNEYRKRVNVVGLRYYVRKQEGWLSPTKRASAAEGSRNILPARQINIS